MHKGWQPREGREQESPLVQQSYPQANHTFCRSNRRSYWPVYQEDTFEPRLHDSLHPGSAFYKDRLGLIYHTRYSLLVDQDAVLFGPYPLGFWLSRYWLAQQLDDRCI